MLPALSLALIINCGWHLLAARTDQKCVFICSLVKWLLQSRTPCLVSFIILTFVQLCSILFAVGHDWLSSPLLWWSPVWYNITVAISRLAWLMSMFPKWWHHCLKNNKTTNDTKENGHSSPKNIYPVVWQQLCDLPPKLPYRVSCADLWPLTHLPALNDPVSTWRPAGKFKGPPWDECIVRRRGRGARRGE